MTPELPSAARVGIEAHGVDTIPDADRIGRPRDVVGILLGSNMCLGVVIFGWLPTSFGVVSPNPRDSISKTR
jgi:hypothetical protein